MQTMLRNLNMKIFKDRYRASYKKNKEKFKNNFFKLTLLTICNTKKFQEYQQWIVGNEGDLGFLLWRTKRTRMLEKKGFS